VHRRRGRKWRNW